MGCRTPCSRMDAVSSSSVSWLNASRGCCGFESMRSTGMMRTPTLRVGESFDSRLTMAGESSRSSDRRRAAVARKSGRAKFDHLPREVAVGSRGVAASGVRRDRASDQRRLAELHGIPDDAGEDVVIADDPELVEHVSSEVGAPVVERRQEPEDAQVAVELEPDRVDDLDEVGQ